MKRSKCRAIYEADRVQDVASDVATPLARYDLESASRLLDRDAFRSRVPTIRYRS